MFRTGLIVLAISAFAAVAAAQDAAAGAKLYVDQKCSVCHSIAGKGNAKGPLDDVGARCPPTTSARGSPMPRR